MKSSPPAAHKDPLRSIPQTTVWADSVPLAESGEPPRLYSRRRIRIGLLLTMFGFLVFLLGARPSLFGMDRSPVIGFVQLAVMLVGLGLICLGGYISIMALWKYEQPSIAADIGLRLVATGYVVAVFAGMADIFGVGSHPLPALIYFGPIQAIGVLVGQGIIAIGFFALIPYHRLAGHLPHFPEAQPPPAA